MTWTPRTTVAAIIEQEGRFLMVEERPGDGPTVLNQPAGHLEENEGLIDAVIRETREETAWGMRPEGLVGIYRWQVPPGGLTYLRFCFHGSCLDHAPEQPLDEGILGTHWMSREEIAAQGERLRSPMVLRCIDDYLAGNHTPLDLLHDLV
jgi:ADP-ribose pyrophosphatase YjhB (NUDIX family)